MRRLKSGLAVATIAVAMLTAPSLPAVAETSEDSVVFFPVPLGNGATYSCAGGPPFVVDEDDSTGNCSVQQVGAPAELICDVPTTITFVHDMHQFVADASLCQ
ncbi:MAG: hypothetical protein M3315_11365 [Actinomycetota bacterium]|nr:hypothetical protein [Actinomycetota bacterium]